MGSEHHQHWKFGHSKEKRGIPFKTLQRSSQKEHNHVDYEHRDRDISAGVQPKATRNHGWLCSDPNREEKRLPEFPSRAEDTPCAPVGSRRN